MEMSEFWYVMVVSWSMAVVEVDVLWCLSLAEGLCV